MATFVRRYPLLAYYVLTFALTAGVVTLGAAPAVSLGLPFSGAMLASSGDAGHVSDRRSLQPSR
jgi:hypothetical protein